MSVDDIGLANHLTLPYSLIHENLLLSVQISNGLGSWLFFLPFCSRAYSAENHSNNIRFKYNLI